MVIDFDDTLLLENSTHAYLRSARPRWLALFFMKVLGAGLRLTRSGPRERFVYRDWLAVLTVTVLMPWSLHRWRREAAHLGATHANTELLDALRGAGTMDVVTFGFAPIVRPLLAAMDTDARLTVAASLWHGHRLRLMGKRAAVEEALGADALAGSLVVTDSRHDSDLLEACRTPLLLVWR